MLKGKIAVGISLIFLKSTMGTPRHSTDESLSTIHMSSHHMYYGGIWNLTQVYLNQKLAIKLVVRHPS